MKSLPRFPHILIFATFAFLAGGCSPSVTTTSRDRCFDFGWKFLRDSISGAEAVDFDDSGWQEIDLPHDWSMEDLQGNGSGSQAGPFSKASPGGPSTGHFIGGTAWYRKHFILSARDDHKTSMLLPLYHAFYIYQLCYYCL
jgi:beta-galactosidase